MRCELTKRVSDLESTSAIRNNPLHIWIDDSPGPGGKGGWEVTTGFHVAIVERSHDESDESLRLRAVEADKELRRIHRQHTGMTIFWGIR